MLILWFIFEPQQTGGTVATTRNTGRSQERKNYTSDKRKDEYALAPEIQQESDYRGILNFSDVPKAASQQIQRLNQRMQRTTTRVKHQSVRESQARLAGALSLKLIELPLKSRSQSPNLAQEISRGPGGEPLYFGAIWAPTDFFFQENSEKNKNKHFRDT